MIFQKEITLPSFPRGFHLITELVLNELDLPKTGILNIFIKHTSAGLTINENADPDVRKDFESGFNNLIKEDEPFYRHTAEGSDDMPAHIKSTIVGQSLHVPVTNHQLNIGVWQGIYLCEFRNNGGRRKLVLSVYY